MIHQVSIWGKLVIFGQTDTHTHSYILSFNDALILVMAGFPLGLENLEKWEGIFQSGKSQGILNRLEKSGKSQGKSHKILENSGNLK